MNPAAFARGIRALGLTTADTVKVEPATAGEATLVTWVRGVAVAGSVVPLKAERVIARIIGEARRANLVHDIDYEGWAATLTFKEA